MILDYVIPFFVLIVLMIGTKYAAIISHWLNNLFNLPHPGPNDIEGSCSCREHEGPNHYSFKDYINANIRNTPRNRR
jgi:hypothetical protein